MLLGRKSISCKERDAKLSSFVPIFSCYIAQRRLATDYLFASLSLWRGDKIRDEMIRLC